MSSNPIAPLFVLSGPSGAGKTTVVNEVIRQCPYRLRRAVTATTRPLRPGEIEGVDYHSWTANRFKAAIQDGQMLEHAVVFGRDYYGTPRSEVEPFRTTGTGVILVIDVQGAAQVRSSCESDLVSIFLDVPSLDELERRLRSRGSEDDARIIRRLETARQERARANEFTYRVMNDLVPNAVRALSVIIAGEYQTRGCQPCSTN
jgi:guanylate kinase